MFRSLTPVVRALLLTNIIVYLIETLTGDRLLGLFALWPPNAHSLYGAPPFEPWQLVSYAFLHGGWLHLFSNMLALYMFGPDSERVLGPARFIQFYLACVIGAALTQIFVRNDSPKAWMGVKVTLNTCSLPAPSKVPAAGV